MNEQIWAGKKTNRIWFNSTLEHELTWKGGEYVRSSFYSYQWASFTVSPQPEGTKKWSDEWVQDGVMQRQMHWKLLCGEAAATPAPPCQPEGGRHLPPQRLSLSTFSCKVIFTFIIILSSSGGSSSWVRGKAVFAASLSLGCFPLLQPFQVESPEASDVCCMKLRGCGESGCLVYWLLLWVHLCSLSKEN